MSFLSRSWNDTLRLAPSMNRLVWRQRNFPISIASKVMLWNVWNRLWRRYMVDTGILSNMKSLTLEYYVTFWSIIIDSYTLKLSDIILILSFMTWLPSLTFESFYRTYIYLFSSATHFDDIDTGLNITSFGKKNHLTVLQVILWAFIRWNIVSRMFLKESVTRTFTVI